MNIIRQVLRTMNKNRGTSLLLIFSLFIGLTVYIIVAAKVNYHSSFDKNVPDHEDIYRIVSSAYTDNTLTISQPRCQRALGETLEKNYPNVLASGYLCKPIDNKFRIGETPFTDEKVFHCSNGFLKLFSIEVIESKTHDLLTRPYVAIVSESFAKKYFPDENPIGKSIIQYPAGTFEIEGVYKDLPVNSHIHADFLMSFHDNMNLPPPLKENWGEFGFYTYLKLNSTASLNAIIDAMVKITQEHNQGKDENSRTSYSFSLQPLTSIHTESDYKNEIEANIQGDYLSVLRLISIYILLISAFNYIYFSHTQFLKKSVHYGIRKVFGAKISQLFYLLFTESVIVHFSALLLFFFTFSILQVTHFSILPESGLANLPFSFWISSSIVFFISMTVIPLIVLLSIYRKKSISLLSPQKVKYTVGYSYRQLLSVFQFVIILFLLSSVIGVQKQLNYLRTRDSGMDISDKLIIKSPANLRRDNHRFTNLESFEQELVKLPAVKSLSISNNVPGDVPSFNYSVSVDNKEQSVKTAIFIANRDFVNAYNIKILAGDRFFSETSNNLNDDGRGSIINQSCLKQLGYSSADDVIGKKIKLSNESGLDNFETVVAGVCNDFNFSSAKTTPGPVILLDWTKNRMVGRYTLTLQPNINKEILLGQIEEMYTQTFVNYPFNYFWLDDYYNLQFREEDLIETNMMVFAVIAIVLGILSMFSMVWHMSVARTKEIGIRKINGASWNAILILLNKDFIRSVVIAFVISVPVAWYAMHKWLENFTYKTDLSWWIFALAGALALVIALLTVSIQSYKAAVRNPIEALRYE